MALNQNQFTPMEEPVVTFPQSPDELDQNEEYFVLNNNGTSILFHEYDKIYKVKGLYEKVFHDELKCTSPQVINEMLFNNIEKYGDEVKGRKIFDYGAGNGMVAEELFKHDPEFIIGVDILEEAKEAAMRDRAKYYENYFVADMAKPGEKLMEKLHTYKFDTLVTVAALGFDHIPVKSFINAFNLIEKGGWIAFNLRDKFLTDNSEESDFKDLLNKMDGNHIEFLDEKTYRHRFSVNGEPLYYNAIVGKKHKELD